GTPGRLLDHLTRGTLRLHTLKILVLDEADKMFEMGFIDDIRRILSKVPGNSQHLLFSATIPPEIQHITRTFMHNPEKVKMQSYVDKSKLMQNYYDIDKNSKFSLLVHILRANPKGLAIIFCGTRHTVDLIQRNLAKQNIHSAALHGGITQARRNQVMEAFHAGKLSVVVASEVAARGLDIKNLNLIINYNIPKTSKEYVHRIGRTARAGEEGKVISLLSFDDYDNFNRVLEDRSLLIHKMKTPDFARVQFQVPQRRDSSFRGRFSGQRDERPRGRGYGSSYGSSHRRF
ncbi:MAG: DEAD/DEAH box helicase, partial [Nanoarchaeota archaeon]